MGKYLHHYTSESDFQADYNDEGSPNSFVCSAGTFTYDRYGEIDNGQPAVYFWKNGDKELITPWRSPKVGAYNYNAGTGAWDIENNTGVEITSVGETEPGKYEEPWVSYTEGTRKRVRTTCRINTMDGATGELDIVEVGTTNIFFEGNCE